MHFRVVVYCEEMCLYILLQKIITAQTLFTESKPNCKKVSRRFRVLLLDDQSIRNVSSGGFGGPNDFDNLTSFQAVVSGHGVTCLDPHQLVLFQLVLVKQLLLLLRHHDHVFWDQFMLRQIDEKFRVQELLQNIFGGHVDQRLFRARSHSLLDYNDGTGNVLFLRKIMDCYSFCYKINLDSVE